MEKLPNYRTAMDFMEKIGLKNPESSLKKDKLSFLKNFIKGFQEYMPFQCVSLMALPTKERHVPTLDEVLEAGLSLEGGLCFTLNNFACFLLQALDFQAHVLGGSYSALGDSHTHVVVLVKDLRYKHDNYIIDVGSGFPFEDPIAVNELPCTRYCAGLEYRYEWKDNIGGTVLRLHRVGDDVPEMDNVIMRGGWRQVFHFNLNPVTFDYFRPYMEEIYMEEYGSDFHTTLRAVSFPSTSGNNEQTMLAFKNESFLTGPMNNAKKDKISHEELADKIKGNFPTIPPTKVDLAVNNMIKIINKSNQ